MLKQLVLVVLLGMSACREEAFFASLRDTEFGKTILQTLQLELSQEHPADNVVHMLKAMKDNLNNEQRAEAEDLGGKVSGCESAATAAGEVITKSAEQKATDEQRLPLMQQEQNDKRGQLEAKQGEEQRNLDKITVLEQERAAEKKEFDQRRDELVGLLSALQEAKQILSQGIPQLKQSNFAEIKTHHQNFLKFYPNKRGFHSMVNLLLSMMQQASAGEKVIAIIDSLMDSIFQVQKEELKADDGRELDFMTQRERLLLVNRRLEGSLADIYSKVEQLGQRILEVQNDIATQDQIIASKSNEKQDWEKSCNDTKRAFDQQSASRQEQLDVIVQCIEIFETKFDMETQAFIQRMRV